MCCGLIDVSKETSKALNSVVLSAAYCNQPTAPLSPGIGIFFGGNLTGFEN
jgi:hypothetical protein